MYLRQKPQGVPDVIERSLGQVDAYVTVREILAEMSTVQRVCSDAREVSFTGKDLQRGFILVQYEGSSISSSSNGKENRPTPYVFLAFSRS